MARHCQAHLRRTPEEGPHAHEEGAHCFPQEARPRTQVSQEPREGRVQGEEGHIQALQEVITLPQLPTHISSLSIIWHYEGSDPTPFTRRKIYLRFLATLRKWKSPTKMASILLCPFFIIAKKRGHGTRRNASDGRDARRLLRHIIRPS